jgi:hypothetical protein
MPLDILALTQNYKEMTMDNVTFVEIEGLNGLVKHAIIDRGNGEYTSMLKSTYDEQQAHLTESVTPTA